MTAKPPGSTDRDVLQDMMLRAKIPYSYDLNHDNEVIAIHVEDGYIGFIAQIDFNDDGSLKRISAWE